MSACHFNRYATSALLGLVCAAFALAAVAQPADTVILNGKIVSADEKGAIHQALAIRDGQIIATGKSVAIRRLPPLRTALKAGVALRGPEETPTRLEALRMYTGGSSWFAHDDAKRGALEVGKLADLAVLSKDYLSVPVDAIGGIHSLLTLVGGRVVYAEGPYKKFE
jgi:predicted amidohydrolase YtcJ